MSDIADKLYGGPSADMSAPSNGTILGAGASSQTAEKTEADSPADALFGNGGEPMANYEPVLGGVFDPVEYQARYDGDHEAIEIIQEVRTGLNQSMVEFGIAEPVAREIMSGFKERIDYPLSVETINAQYDESTATLRQEWGGDFDKMLAGAKRVVDEADKRIPGLKWRLSDSGYGNDVKLIKNLARVAKRRGLC